MADRNLGKESVDRYISEFPDDVQVILKKIREIIANIAPEASEKISYGIPTFYLKGNMIHYAAFHSHIGIYPGADGVEMFRSRAMKEGYGVSKGTIRFLLDAPIPYDFISEIARYRYRQQNIKE